MKRCVVCGVEEAVILGNQRWTYWDVEYRLAECRECGSVFTDPLPDDATIAKVYETLFDYRWYQDHYDAKYRDCLIRLGECKDILGRRVLDFGGGEGYFSKAASRLGHISRTYDPFREKGGEAAGEWDTVVAFHVLEHANDLDRTMAEIRKLVVPGGTILLAVPNYLGRGYRHLGMKWIWAQPPLVHIHHFTAKGLMGLVARHGFEDLRVSYHERWDANLYADLKWRKFYRKIDSLWGRKYINGSPLLRKKAAAISSWFRARSLARAVVDCDTRDDGLSELQLTGKLNPS